MIYSSCTNIISDHYRYFGPEFNDERIKIGLPIIQPCFSIKSDFTGPNLKSPEQYSVWFTCSEFINEAYYATKNVHFKNKDTILAEEDLYFNKDRHTVLSTVNDKIKITPMVIKDKILIRYVYSNIGYFKTYKKGFTCLLYIDNKYPPAEIDLDSAELVIKSWGLNRLNY